MASYTCQIYEYDKVSQFWFALPVYKFYILFFFYWSCFIFYEEPVYIIFSTLCWIFLLHLLYWFVCSCIYVCVHVRVCAAVCLLGIYPAMKKKTFLIHFLPFNFYGVFSHVNDLFPEISILFHKYRIYLFK